MPQMSTAGGRRGMWNVCVVNLEASTFNWANLKSKLTARSTGGPKKFY